MTFPNHRQPQGSNACGPVTLQNIYEHFSVQKDLVQILNELGINQNDTTNQPELARNLLSNKFLSKLISANPYTVSREWIGLSSEEIQKKLKAWLIINTNHGWRKDILCLLFYLQEGGVLEIHDNLSVQTIDDALDAGYVVIVTAERSWLWGKRKLIGVDVYDDIRGESGGHIVAVFGKDGEFYLVSDPITSSEGGLVQVSKKILLHAVTTYNPQILVVKAG